MNEKTFENEILEQKENGKINREMCEMYGHFSHQILAFV